MRIAGAKHLRFDLKSLPYYNVFPNKEYRMEKQLSRILAQYPAKQDQLIPILQEVQKQVGYLSKAIIPDIAFHTKVSESQAYGAATFFAQFRFSPIGRNHLTVCRGTACHVKGVKPVLEEIKRQLDIEEGETTPDGAFSLETVACVGCCALAPVVQIGKDTHSGMTPAKIKKLLRGIREKDGGK